MFMLGAADHQSANFTDGLGCHYGKENLQGCPSDPFPTTVSLSSFLHPKSTLTLNLKGRSIQMLSVAEADVSPSFQEQAFEDWRASLTYETKKYKYGFSDN